MNRLGLVSIRTDAKALGSLRGNLFYAAVGSNTGNLLFTEAVRKQVAGKTEHLGFAFDPERVNAELDALVIPAANWISDTHDWGHLADIIERVSIPCIMIGLGAQASIGGSVGDVPEGTLRFLRAVADRSELVSVRGNSSAEILASFGIRNVCVTGCPSLYWSCRGDFEVPKCSPNLGSKIAVHSTRFGVPTTAAQRQDDIHRRLYRYALESDSEIIYQSEVPELLITLFGDNSSQGADGALADSDDDPFSGVPSKSARDALVSYYGAPSWDELVGLMSSRGLAFVNVEAWIEGMSEQDFVFGTRLHGTIAALLAGVPAMLVAHDLRTSEVACFAGIPQVSTEEFLSVDRASIEMLYSTLDLSNFNRRYRQNYAAYRKFLEKNGLAHNLQ